MQKIIFYYWQNFFNTESAQLWQYCNAWLHDTKNKWSNNVFVGFISKFLFHNVDNKDMGECVYCIHIKHGR